MGLGEVQMGVEGGAAGDAGVHGEDRAHRSMVERIESRAAQSNVAEAGVERGEAGTKWE